MHFEFNHQNLAYISKIQKKNILFFLICGITNLYVRYIPDIKLKKYQKHYFAF